MKKKIKNLKYMFIVRAIFTVIFIVSLFSSLSVLANTNPFKIIDAVISEKSEGVTGDIESFTGDEVKDNIKFYKLEDSVTYKLTLKNTRNDEVTISSISDDNSNDYIVYSYDEINDLKVGANQTIDFYVKAIYKNELEDTTKRNQINNVNFIINYIEKDNEVSARLLLNPNTGDNVYISFILLFVSSCCLVCSFIINKKNKKKIIKTYSIILIGVLGLPIMVNALSAAFQIKLNDVFGLYDKVIVTYNSAGNSHSANSTYDEVINNLEVPDARDGYSFDRWEVNGEEFDPSKPLTEDITLEAKWNLIDYSINYNLDGGSVSTRNKETYNIEDDFTLNNPSRDGYKFTGWIGTDLSEKTKNVTIKNKFGNREYTANWETIKYTIIYSGLEEDEIVTLKNKSTYTILDTITLAEPTFRYDSDGDKTEKFVGWEDEDGNVSTNVVISNSFGNKKYTAKWESVAPNTYTITYNLDNGSCENETSFTKKTETFKLNNPSKDGYEFTGWSGTDLEGSSNKDVYVNKGTRKNLEFTAHYSPITYAINYDLNGGSGSNTTSYTIEDRVAINNPTRDNYNFVGWSGTGLSQTTKDLVLEIGNFGIKNYTANWEAVPYNITYNLNGGSVNGNPETYTVLSNITLNRPVKEGYTFLGWLDADEGEPVLDYSISEGHSGDITLNAVWQANTYEVIFNGNGNDEGTSMSNQELTYDTESNLSSNLFTKEGLVFKEWNTKEDGTGTSYSNGATVLNLVSSGTITLYAQWTEGSAMTINGNAFNLKMIALADDNASNITEIKRSSIAPDESLMNDDHLVSVNNEENPVPIYMWYDNGTIYWWTKAERPKLNSYASYSFRNLSEITSLDLSDFDISEVDSFAAFLEFDTKLETIIFGDNFDTSNVTSFSYMFRGCRGLKTLDLGDKFYTSKATNLFGMFQTCANLETLNLGSHFDTSNVTSFGSMFSELYKLKSLNLGNLFNTKSATTMDNMFAYCETITELNLGDKFYTSNVTNMNRMFYWCKSLKSLDLGEYFDTSKVEKMSYMFQYCKDLETLNLGNLFDTSKVTDMRYMFASMYAIESLNLGNLFDTSNVESMYYMFYYCQNLKSLNLGNKFNTEKVTNMNNMFRSCENMESLTLGNLFDTKNVKDMSMMFKDCKKLTSLNLGSKFDTSKVQTFSYMFENCESLGSLNLGNLFNTSSSTTMYAMFSGCRAMESLNLGNSFNTENVTNMGQMFNLCNNLKTLDLGNLFDTSKVTDMNYMFYICKSLTSLKLGNKFDTSNVTDMNSMFASLSNITVLNLGTKFNTSKVTNMMNMFNGDSKLTTIYAPTTFVTTAVTKDQGIFVACNSIIGGANTHYISYDISYAHIDGGPSNPGYFTQP